jgi:hypothetical protein
VSTTLIVDQHSAAMGAVRQACDGRVLVKPLFLLLYFSFSGCEVFIHSELLSMWWLVCRLSEGGRYRKRVFIKVWVNSGRGRDVRSTMRPLVKYWILRGLSSALFPWAVSQIVFIVINSSEVIWELLMQRIDILWASSKDRWLLLIISLDIGKHLRKCFCH